MADQKRLALKVAVAVLVAAISVGFYLYGSNPGQGEPEGFRGIRWGSSVQGLPGMRVIAEEGDLKFFEREGDEKKVEGTAVERVVYGFYRDRFYSVLIYYSAPDAFDKLKGTFSKLYGEPSQPDAGAKKFFWNGESVGVLVSYDDSSKSGRVSYFFKPIQLETELNR